jgi:hypothetical protein
MGIIAKIGPLEISLILFFGVLFLYRIQAAPESRVATALVFICSAKFIVSVISGFSVSAATKLSFGELDTVFAYLMLAFAFFEVLLLKRVSYWNHSDLWVLGGLLGLGFLNLVWQRSFNIEFNPSDLLYVLSLLLFILLRPTRTDLRFLPYFGAVLILLIFITALTKYQNPMFPYSQIDYGLGGQYQNRVWGFFGLEERFRGPYYHPNQLGIQITFLSLLVLLKPTKFYLAILPVSFTLLFLASSRTSLLALTIGLFLRLYFDFAKREKANSPHVGKDFSKDNSYSRMTPRNFLAGLVVAGCIFMVTQRIIGTNTTGTGRLENYRNSLSAIRENLLLGQGPSLFSINSTENTYLTLLSYYGLIGLALLLAIVFATILSLMKTPRSERHSFHMTVAIFLVATAGESLLTGGSRDTGLFYFLVLLALTRVQPSRKYLPQPQSSADSYLHANNAADFSITHEIRV